MRTLSQVVKKRRSVFASLVPLVEDLATAKVNALSKLVRGSYGVVLIENDLMIAQGMCMFHLPVIS